jgi:hypothetical protein
VLKDDLELSREDIQLLSNGDALAAFFAKLGYDTNDRLTQNVAAMGFSSDNLKSAITHIERLASQDARLFEVYLYVISHIALRAYQPCCRFHARCDAGNRAWLPGVDQTPDLMDLSSRFPQIVWKEPVFYLHDHAGMWPIFLNPGATTSIFHRW